MKEREGIPGRERPGFGRADHIVGDRRDQRCPLWSGPQRAEWSQFCHNPDSRPDSRRGTEPESTDAGPSASSRGSSIHGCNQGGNRRLRSYRPQSGAYSRALVRDRVAGDRRSGRSGGDRIPAPVRHPSRTFPGPDLPARRDSRDRRPRGRPARPAGRLRGHGRAGLEGARSRHRHRGERKPAAPRGARSAPRERRVARAALFAAGRSARRHDRRSGSTTGTSRRSTGSSRRAPSPPTARRRSSRSWPRSSASSASS